MEKQSLLAKIENPHETIVPGSGKMGQDHHPRKVVPNEAHTSAGEIYVLDDPPHKNNL